MDDSKTAKQVEKKLPETSKKSSEAKKINYTKEIKNLKKKLKDRDKEIANLNDKYLRLAADFDNYRKRTDKDISRIIEYAGENVLQKILPVLDDIERAVFNNVDDNKTSVQEGLNLIHKKFVKTLEDLGVKPLESLGKEFDPNFHHAMLARDEKDAESNTVVEEFEKGYEYKDHILRYAKVVVSK